MCGLTLNNINLSCPDTFVKIRKRACYWAFTEYGFILTWPIAEEKKTVVAPEIGGSNQIQQNSTSKLMAI